MTRDEALDALIRHAKGIIKAVEVLRATSPQHQTSNTGTPEASRTRPEATWQTTNP